jgi:hypothetical protein
MSDARSRLGQLLLEGLVVILSILIAFFLEGWRADRELSREIAQELANVRVELQRNRDLIEIEIATLDRNVSAAQAFIDLLGASQEGSVSVPDTLVFLGAQWHPSFRPSLGAVNALISSGRLAQVENEELRLGLAGLDEAVNDSFEEEVFARQIGVEQLLPLIAEGADLAPVSRIADSFFGLEQGLELTPQERSVGRAVRGSEDLAVPNTRPLRGALIRRTTWLRAARAEFGQLHDHVGHLITLIPVQD